MNIPNKNIRDLNVTKLDRLYVLKEYYGEDIGSKLFDFKHSLNTPTSIPSGGYFNRS